MGLPVRRGHASISSRKVRLTRGMEMLHQTAVAIQSMADALDDDFLVAVDKILAMKGCLVVSGMGKAGLIGRKLSATFASTGTRSHFLHPAEAVHGDLGCIGPKDVLLVLSNSGATEEVVRLLPFFSRRAAGLIALTSNGNSPLARAADICLVLPPCREVCRHNLAPSTSTASMLALGDALALVVSEARGFSVENFAELHPGGSLGRRFALVDEVMRPLETCRIAQSTHTARQIFVEAAKPGRRSGAVMLVDDQGRLEGIFTDSDLARLMEQRRDQDLDQPISQLMTKAFSAIQSGAKLTDATKVMVQRKISELPVVDANDRPIGMIDVTDVLELEHAVVASTPSKDSESPPENNSMSSLDWDDGPVTLRVFDASS
jgi:arabinose-5-phosphate isomerase